MHSARRSLAHVVSLLPVVVLALACGQGDPDPDDSTRADTPVVTGDSVDTDTSRVFELDSAARAQLACKSPPDSNPGVRGDPRNEPAFRTIGEYVAKLCFDGEGVEGSYPGVPNSRLVLKPEGRMHRSHPDSLAAGHGMVVAILGNKGSHFRRGGWNRDLDGGRSAYLWFGKTPGGDPYAVLFRVVRTVDNGYELVPLRTATWNANTDGTHTSAKAGWYHRPADLPADSAAGVDTARVQTATGWVSCLRGCCSASRVFEQ